MRMQKMTILFVVGAMATVCLAQEGGLPLQPQQPTESWKSGIAKQQAATSWHCDLTTTIGKRTQNITIDLAEPDKVMVEGRIKKKHWGVYALGKPTTVEYAGSKSMVVVLPGMLIRDVKTWALSGLLTGLEGLLDVKKADTKEDDLEVWNGKLAQEDLGTLLKQMDLLHLTQSPFGKDHLFDADLEEMIDLDASSGTAELRVNPDTLDMPMFSFQIIFQFTKAGSVPKKLRGKSLRIKSSFTFSDRNKHTFHFPRGVKKLFDNPPKKAKRRKK